MFDTHAGARLRRQASRLLGVALVSLAAFADHAAHGAPQTGAELEPSTLLEYDAFLAGMKVGEATVVLRMGGARYEVSGTAVARGALEGFSDWRNRFQARGGILEGRAQPQLFTYLEADRSKSREVVVRGRVLQVTKNGRVRPERPAPSGVDLLAGLFVHPRCQGDQLLHTGRHAYRVTRLSSEPGRCRLLVIDDDEDRYEVDVVFARRDGRVVPAHLVVRGLVNGSIILREGAAEPSAAAADRAVDP